MKITWAVLVSVEVCVCVVVSDVPTVKDDVDWKLPFQRLGSKVNL